MYVCYSIKVQQRCDSQNNKQTKQQEENKNWAVHQTNACFFWYQRYEAGHDKTYTAQNPANNSAVGHQDNVYSDASAKTEAVRNKNNSAVGHQVSVCYSDVSGKYEAVHNKNNSAVGHQVSVCYSDVSSKLSTRQYATRPTSHRIQLTIALWAIRSVFVILMPVLSTRQELHRQTQMMPMWR